MHSGIYNMNDKVGRYAGIFSVIHGIKLMLVRYTDIIIHSYLIYLNNEKRSQMKNNVCMYKKGYLDLIKKESISLMRKFSHYCP